MLVKVTVKYDGSRYFGWQEQNGKNQSVETIGELINRGASIINKRPTQVVASGRTDRGVHALGQVFHFENDFNIENEKLRFALNNTLPDDIEIITVKQVDNDFHARFSATSKEYHYYLNAGKYDLFQKDYINQYNFPLDYDLMLEAAKLFEGRHDFTAFNTTPLSEKRNQIRTINKFEIEKKGDIYIFKIEGSSFLRHMVRMMVGMIVYIGDNKRKIEDLEKLLNREEGQLAPFNIEPNGLYLIKVNY